MLKDYGFPSLQQQKKKKTRPVMDTFLMKIQAAKTCLEAQGKKTFPRKHFS